MRRWISSGRMLVIGAVLLLAAEVTQACPVCFGDPASPLTDGANKGILFLLGVVGIVQAGFVALFWSFWRRSRHGRADQREFRLIEGGAAESLLDQG